MSNVRILHGVVSCDHIHIHFEYPPSLSISKFVQRLKGRTSRKLQQEFPNLSKKYWGNISGQLYTVFGVLVILQMKL